MFDETNLVLKEYNSTYMYLVRLHRLMFECIGFNIQCYSTAYCISMLVIQNYTGHPITCMCRRLRSEVEIDLVYE